MQNFSAGDLMSTQQGATPIASDNRDWLEKTIGFFTSENAGVRALDRQQSFNSAESLKNRQFQEYMSNTAHQREIQDLIKAGLNPILSAGGQGASSPSGSAATSGSQPNTGKGFLDTLNKPFQVVNSALNVVKSIK